MKIIIDTKPDGSMSFHVEGVKGKGCKDLTDALKEVSGEVIKEEVTSEYYEQPVKTNASVRH